jgi:hypothetical protein
MNEKFGVRKIIRSGDFGVRIVWFEHANGMPQTFNRCHIICEYNPILPRPFQALPQPCDGCPLGGLHKPEISTVKGTGGGGQKRFIDGLDP